MSIICYLGSLIISLFSLIMTIILIFVDEESTLVKFYGNKETYICLCIAIILIALGLISDKRNEEN